MAGGQAIVAPHGAWDLTGEIAGAAFAAIRNLPPAPPAHEPEARGISRVILLGPHHETGEEGIYLSESVSFNTPLGDLPVDLKLSRKLAACSTLIRLNDTPHLSEHSLEVLLPFVKYCLSGVRIIPILVNGKKPALVSCLACALRIVLEEYMEESLVVISSNLSHNLNPDLALSMAEEFCSLLSCMDAGAFLAAFSEKRINSCGCALVAALLESGLLNGKRFSALTPLASRKEEQGETVYYSAFITG